MKTWEMVKAISENPNKRFKSLIDNTIVRTEFTAIHIINCRCNCKLHIDDEWEEIE